MYSCELPPENNGTAPFIFALLSGTRLFAEPCIAKEAVGIYVKLLKPVFVIILLLYQPLFMDR